MSTYYVQVNVFCLALLSIMYICMRSKRGIRQTRQTSMFAIMLITAIMCVSDMVCWLIDGKQFAGADVINHTANMVFYATVTITSYVWLVYVHIRTGALGVSQKKKNLLWSIPMIVMLLLILTNPLTRWLYSVDEANVYSRSDGVVLHWVISYGYLAVATVKSVHAIRRAETRSRREELYPLLLFIVFPALAALLQTTFFSVTATQCGITLSIVMITIRSLQSEITTDELTGLNNRAAFDKYVSDHLRSSGQAFSVLMCDIDKFKTINDTMGHNVGDLALKCVAATLASVRDDHANGAFLCRYGGDEFVFCIPDGNFNFEPLIRRASEKLQAPDRIPTGIMRLNVSSGAASGICEKYEDLTALLKEADTVMYENKKANGLAR